MENPEIEIIKSKIKGCLNKIYTEDKNLFEKNKGRGVCERCLVFRFALYLQEAFNDYIVDCDYNSSSQNGKESNGKSIPDSTGKISKKFIDIIIHKRENNVKSDFICFEIKKWNNKDNEAVKKDENNLKVLTNDYGYKYGFHLIFGKTKKEVEHKIFRNGEFVENWL